MTDTRDFVRTVATSIPPSDFGSTRAVNAMAAAIDGRYGGLLAALKRFFPGDLVDENVGWRGTRPSDSEMLQCEFCGQEHVDCTLIPHRDHCPVTQARAEIARAKAATPCAS